jgi:hypothetical protein
MLILTEEELIDVPHVKIRNEPISLQMLAHIGTAQAVMLTDDPQFDYSDDGVLTEDMLMPVVQKTLDSINASSLTFEQKLQLAVDYMYLVSLEFTDLLRLGKIVLDY